MMGTWRRLVVLPVLAFAAAACGGAASDAGEEPGPTDASTTSIVAAEPAGLPEGPSALQTTSDPAFPDPLVDPGEILSGGPPPDGIPPIDEPAFLEVAAADEQGLFLDREPVVALVVGDDARAYPVQVMIWHEIVNDTVGGVPVAVTYCPLCNSAVSYRREVRGVETTFGTSGRLFASALVMYDRATETLWTHFDGRAVVGLLAGDELEPVPSPLLAWGEFRHAYPEGLVLDPSRTGHERRYGTNPYVGYDDPETEPHLFRGTADDRARAKQRVVGVALDGQARAWTLDLVARTGATNTDVAGVPLVILWREGQATALESREIAGGRDVGSVGVFSPIVAGQVLTLRRDGDGFIDEATGSRWDVSGLALEGPLVGSRMDRVHHLDTFWFAWSTYQPGTDLIEN